MRKETSMKQEKPYYTAPAVRVVDTRAESNFLQSGGGNGNIDPGTEDPWGDF